MTPPKQWRWKVFPNCFVTPQLKLNVRPSLRVQDRKTKHGTRIDGQEIRDQTITLDEESYHIHLGKYEPAFRSYVVSNFYLPTPD